MANHASSGVGNASAQTVEAHVPREWEAPASEALREGWREAEVCAEEVAAPREPMRGRFSAEAAPASSRSSYRQGRCKAPSGSSFTAQSKAPSGRATCRTISIAMRNLPNQHHREADVLSNNGAKRAGAEGVRGSNLACFLKNFVSNYIVIFYIMLFRVHL